MISRTCLLASATIFAGAIVLASSAGAVGSGMVGDPGVHRTAGDDTLLDIAPDHDVDNDSALTSNPDGTYQLFRVGDAVASRNIHAAIYDSLRLCSLF